MSLFKARDWWTHRVGVSGETFDSPAFCVSPLNHESGSDEFDMIIVGGSCGTLAIFSPIFEPKVAANPREATLLETQLSEPIIGILTGVFASGTDRVHLAVLHPHRLSVYSVTTALSNELAKQSTIETIYEHRLERSAYSMIKGNFGGVKIKEFICVQSLDGVISFFEQENFAFCRFLPGFLLPGAMVYVPSVDGILVAKSDWCIETYKYKNLAMASFKDDKNMSAVSGKKLIPDWTFNFGEHILELRYLALDTSPHVLILGERSLMCVSDSGQLRFVKLLNYSPMGIIAFRNDLEDWAMSIVISRNQSIYIYRENQLKWASRLTFQPVAFAKANVFKNIQGSLVTLSEDGQIACSYLGTDPELHVENSAVDLPHRDINYEQAEKELAMLTKRIRSGSAASIPNKQKEFDINIKLDLSRELEVIGGRFETLVMDPSGHPALCIPATIHLNSAMPVGNVQIVIHVEPPLKASWDLKMISSLNERQAMKVWFYQYDSYLPASLKASVIVTFAGTRGTGPRVIRKQLSLPLNLVLRLETPFKDADHKITIQTNQSVVDLQTLFAEFSHETPSANAIGFQYFSGEQVTILASKSSQKYRLQSDSFAALWMVTSEIVNRLQRHFKDCKKFTCTRSCAIPLQDVFHEIDAHFMARRHLDQRKEVLAQRSAQFRAVQRRLLVKFKDKTPSPLSNLDSLLEATFDQIAGAVSAIHKQHTVVNRCARHLSCSLRLLILLLQLEENGIPTKELNILEAALNPSVNEMDYLEWEQSAEAALGYFMRAHLGRSAKEENSAVIVAPGQEPLKDTGKLKKHLTNVIDKLSKGGKIEMDRAAQKTSNKSLSGIQNTETSWEEQDEPPPSVRLGSARPSRTSQKSLRFSETVRVVNPASSETVAIEGKEDVTTNRNPPTHDGVSTDTTGNGVAAVNESAEEKKERIEREDEDIVNRTRTTEVKGRSASPSRRDSTPSSAPHQDEEEAW